MKALRLPSAVSPANRSTAAISKSTKRARAKSAAAAVVVAVDTAGAAVVEAAAVAADLAESPAVINSAPKTFKTSISQDGCAHGASVLRCTSHQVILLSVYESGTTDRARRHHQNGAAEHDVPCDAGQRT